MSPSLATAREASKMTLHFMSDKELGRVGVLRDLTAGRLTIATVKNLTIGPRDAAAVDR